MPQPRLFPRTNGTPEAPAIQRTARAKQQAIARANTRAKLLVYATELGVPLPTLLMAGIWLSKKKCPYCELGNRVLRQIKLLGKEKAIAVLTQILEAKSRKDYATLIQIREELNAGN